MEGRSVRRVARAKIKQPRRGFTAFFEVGVAELFLEIESEREAHSTRIPCHSHAVVVIKTVNLRSFLFLTAPLQSHVPPIQHRRKSKGHNHDQ
jgi:hypothetical protein